MNATIQGRGVEWLAHSVSPAIKRMERIDVRCRTVRHATRSMIPPAYNESRYGATRHTYNTPDHAPFPRTSAPYNTTAYVRTRRSNASAKKAEYRKRIV